MTHARPRSRYRARYRTAPAADRYRPRVRTAMAAAALAGFGLVGGAAAATSGGLAASAQAAVLTTFGNPHAAANQSIPSGLPPGVTTLSVAPFGAGDGNPVVPPFAPSQAVPTTLPGSNLTTLAAVTGGGMQPNPNEASQVVPTSPPGSNVVTLAAVTGGGGMFPGTIPPGVTGAAAILPVAHDGGNPAPCPPTC